MVSFSSKGRRRREACREKTRRVVEGSILVCAEGFEKGEGIENARERRYMVFSRKRYSSHMALCTYTYLHKSPFRVCLNSETGAIATGGAQCQSLLERDVGWNITTSYWPSSARFGDIVVFTQRQSEREP